MARSGDRGSSGAGRDASSKRARAPTGGSAGIWRWATSIAVVLVAFHVLSLWYRWLRPDPEFLTFTSNVAAVLAIASFLGLQTERGKQFTGRLDTSRGIGRAVSTPARIAALAVAAAVITGLALYVGSPIAADAYRERGAEALEDGRFSSAVSSFRLAESLSPGSASTHYNLASAYEALYDHEAAIAEYQRALMLDDTFWPAFNNLGLLNIRARHDPEAALVVLLTGRQQADSTLGQSVIGKNIGWAYLDKGMPSAAVDILDDSIVGFEALRAGGEAVEIYLSDAYRLEALAYAMLGRGDDARGSWQDSLGFALAVSESPGCRAGTERSAPECIDAIRFAAEANEYLAAPGAGS